ncbi:glycyl-radical enzyme activating protein [Lachnospiraceae bacterium OttesenSCG-928-E19]|nr:glycyl-radical enzyme activating protein [Lachnospiraceae bacterium OttesenSCG-928-E19]
MTTVTSIQKYSIHDGDGIRTSAFFKGCPLSCVWCHNPETQSYKKQLTHDADKCTGCGRCGDVCPQQAVTRKGITMITDFESCTACGACLDSCILNLREIMGTEYTVEELVRELRKDEMFYEESGGGVTLSGGEVMTQDMDYIEALAKALERYGITITIDTCGYAPYANFKRLLPYVDTFLYDIKVMDESLHRKYTGVDNKLILENLEKLSADGARIYIRIPVIKEVNGTDVQMLEVVDYLKKHDIHVAQVNLLPYHNTGSGKYGKLGQEYEGLELHAPSQDEMEHFRTIFIEAGFRNTKIGG